MPGYFTYAMQSDATTGNQPGVAENQINMYVGDFSFTQSSVYTSTQNDLTDVGAFSGSEGFYGTFAMNADVYPRNDLDGLENASRGVIGGFWFGGPSSAANMTVAGQAATYEGSDVGFWLSGPVAVPEPATWVMGVVGLACAGWGAVRRSERPWG